nr:spatacsin isoform X1 [Hydra vulgaris]
MAVTECRELKFISPLLKTWSFEENIVKCRTSPCGNFLAVKGNSILSIIHMTLEYQVDVKVKYTDFIWALCNLNKENLSAATGTWYFVTIDIESNVEWHSISRNPQKHFQHKLVKSTDVKTLLKISDNDISLLFAEYDKSCSQQSITCLISKSSVVVITISNQKEPLVESTYSICNSKFVEWQCSENIIYLLQEDYFVQILDKQSLHLRQSINMKDILNFEVIHFGVINDIALFVFDSNNTFHVYPLSCEQSAPINFNTNEYNTGEWKTRLHLLKAATLLQNKPKSKLLTPNSFCGPMWMNELDIILIHVSKSIVLLKCEKSADKSSYIIKYDYQENEFAFCKIPSGISLSFGEGHMIPILFVSASQIMLPFFGVSQEDLIDKVIQFSNISMAEKICKANEWDQFSIPLYTLEVGLRLRQLDAIEIFLKSRDKPFTRHWKQFYYKLNSNLVSFESDELKETIKKLQGSILTASKRKHEDNFFEGLFMVTICYLNSLIQDGIETLKSLPEVVPNKKISLTNQSTDLNLFEDLHETLNYLAQVVVKLRTYLKVSFNDNPQTDSIDGGKQHQFNSQDLLINGKIGTWQKNQIFQKKEVEKGSLDSAIDIGKQIAQEKLVQNDIDGAVKILLNIGLEPNRELKSIYFETSKSSLRGLMFPRLQKKGLLDERDTEDFRFLKELEKYYISGNQHQFKFTLKQVRQWNSQTRKKIVFDGIFLSNATETINEEDADSLWDYLISHNHISIIEHWLLGDECKQVFPPFNIRVIELSCMPRYMEKRLLNLLVKNGYYPQFLINNFLNLLEYLGKNDLVFSSVHPFDFYKYPLSIEKRKSLVDDFNYNFCQFCQENNLPVLMWRFINFYNLHLFNIKFPYKVSSWLTLMFNIYEYVHSPGQDLISNIFMQNISLNNQSSKTLSNLLTNHQVLLVLALILVSGKSLEQVIEGNDDVFKVDKQLLFDSLQSFPKLLQSIQNEKSSNMLNLTIYQLLQDNTEINVLRWFTWQEGNKLALKEEVLLELPHFSHPLLVSKYAQVIKLDYEYYLKEGRPMYAYLIFKKENLCEASACKTSYKLAIENFRSLSVVSSCCFFLELLDQDNEMIKIDAKVIDLLFKYQKPSEDNSLLVGLFLEKKDFLEILKLLESSIEQLISDNLEIKFSYKAVWYWQLAVDFCRVHFLPITVRYLENCCNEENWLQFFLFIHVHQIPSSEAISALNEFMKNKPLKEHLIAIVSSTKQVSIVKERKKKRHQSFTKKRDVRAQFYSRIGASASREPIMSTPENTASNEKNEDFCDGKRQQKNTGQRLPDIASFSGSLLDTLLECEKYAEPWKALLCSSYVSYHAFLPILAACYKEASRLECICSWYLCILDDQDRCGVIKKLQNGLSEGSFDLSNIFNHTWKTEDLFTIIKEMFLHSVKYGEIPSQGFQIFMPGHVLVKFLQCIESFLNRLEHNKSVSLLSSFQSSFILFLQAKSSPYDITAEKMEDFTQECLSLMVSNCESQLDVQLLVNIIVESKYGNKFTKKVLDFDQIKKAVDIIYNSNIDYQLANLFTYDTDIFDQEIKFVFTILLQNQAYKQAKVFSDLFKLPFADNVLICEVKKELNYLQKTNSWNDVLLRKSFWKKIDFRLFENNCGSLIAGTFFENQANNDSFSFGEKASLFMYSLKWFSFNKSVEINKLLKLDKLMWFYKIKSLVGIPNQVEAINEFAKEQSFILFHTSTGEYDFEHESSIDTASDIVAFDFTEQEEKTYHDLINCLLDHDFVAEALRIAILFKRTSIHLDIVKTCMMLAQGKLNVESVSNNVKAILASTTSNHVSASSVFDASFSRTTSISSINSNSTPFSEMHDFVFIEDVLNALEKLTLRAKHGKKICQKELLIFKVASALQLSYDEINSQDKFNLLKKILEAGFDKRKQLSKLFINLFSLENTEVVTFVADSMISMIRIDCGIETDTHQSSNESMKLPSFDDIVSLLQLTSLPSCVGQKILNEVYEVSRRMNNNRGINERPKNWKYLVDLLICAHHCATISCDMEGIADILRAARISSNLLAAGHQYNLLVRLLTHVGRFKEMFYVIETLYNHHHFEYLCRKGIYNEGRLKQALIDFMLTYHKEDKENFELILVGFGMYREYAEKLQEQAENKIELVQEKLKAGHTKEVVSELKDIQQSLSYASDYFRKDGCFHYSHKCLQTARLVELQIYLLPSAKCVLGLSIQEVKQFLNNHDNFLEAFLVAETYGLHDPSIWVDPLYEIVLLKDNLNISYLQQFNCYQCLTTIVAELATKARLSKSTFAISNMRKILSYVRDVKVKLKVYKELGFTDMEKSLNESSAGAFLRDQMFYM